MVKHKIYRKQLWTLSFEFEKNGNNIHKQMRTRVESKIISKIWKRMYSEIIELQHSMKKEMDKKR